MAIPSTFPRISAARKSRWLWPAVAAVALHLLGLLWANGVLHLPGMTAPEAEPKGEKIITATLQPSVVHLAQPPPREVIIPKPRKPRPPAPRVQAAPAAPVVEVAPAPAEIIVTAPAAPEPAPTPVVETPVPDAEPLPVIPPPAESVAQFRISPPPPVTLKYNVEKIAIDGQTLSGHGTISWQMQDGRYVINGDAGILFISALSFKSEGEIDAYGIAPEIYREKRFRKSETNTHFRRGAKLISFSASELNYPRKGGEQDRASIIWQLAGIGRGDSAKIIVGAEIDIFVAGVRDGEIWPIRVLGEEQIEIGPGKTRVWHMVRAPKAGSYDQKLDIWLAPDLEWYPVKLRYTEINGDYLDLSLSSLSAPDAR
jgi:hypothetical protein